MILYILLMLSSRARFLWYEQTTSVQLLKKLCTFVFMSILVVCKTPHIWMFCISLTLRATSERFFFFCLKGQPLKALTKEPFSSCLLFQDKEFSSLVELAEQLKFGPVTVRDEDEDLDIWCNRICPGLPFNGAIAGYKKSKASARTWGWNTMSVVKNYLSDLVNLPFSMLFDMPVIDIHIILCVRCIFIIFVIAHVRQRSSKFFWSKEFIYQYRRRCWCKIFTFSSFSKPVSQ